MGFVVGYVCGAKTGPEGYDKLRQAWKTVAGSKEFQSVVASATAMVPEVAQQGREVFAEQLKGLTEGKGRLGEAWRTVPSSKEFQSLRASGTALIEGLVAQGKTVVSERFPRA